MPTYKPSTCDFLSTRPAYYVVVSTRRCCRLPLAQRKCRPPLFSPLLFSPPSFSPPQSLRLASIRRCGKREDEFLRVSAQFFFALTFINLIKHFQSYHFIVINRQGWRHERIVLGGIRAITASAGTRDIDRFSGELCRGEHRCVAGERIASAGNGGDSSFSEKRGR